jgi:putative membrane protein
MTPHLHVNLESWECPIWLTVTLVFLALAYVRGWRHLRSISPNAAPAWGAANCLFGLFLIWIAIASPLAALDHEWLTAHMVQHLLLMTFAPPLILLSAPVTSLVSAVPPRFAQAVADRAFQWWPIQAAGRALGHPAFCWLAATATLVVWHVPGTFTLGMQSETWHAVEQTSFLVTGLLFWWPIIQPWPSVPTGPQWWMVLYLFFATLPCDALSGFLVFSDRVAYPVYLTTARHSALSVLGDQQCAGALMWTSVTIVYFVIGMILATRLLSAGRLREDSWVQSETPGGAAWQGDPESGEAV